jgi:hypothetical protein
VIVERRGTERRGRGDDLAYSFDDPIDDGLKRVVQIRVGWRMIARPAPKSRNSLDHRQCSEPPLELGMTHPALLGVSACEDTDREMFGPRYRRKLVDVVPSIDQLACCQSRSNEENVEVLEQDPRDAYAAADPRGCVDHDAPKR